MLCHAGLVGILVLAGSPVSGRDLAAVNQTELALSIPHAQLVCGDCHGSDVEAAADVTSPVPAERINRTCGGCHEAIRDRVAGSSHRYDGAADRRQAITCISCHGTHAILAASDPDSPTSPGRVVFTCAECHQNPLLLHDDELPQASLREGSGSFHGIAYLRHMTGVANCVSCHGAHDVLPAGNARSRVAEPNLAATCSSCHHNADAALIARLRHPRNGVGWRDSLRRLRLHFPIAETSLNPLFVSGVSAAVGFLTGIFGFGGGFLMTPLLILIGIPAAVAVATDAAQITAGATAGGISHARSGNLDLKLGLVIVIGGWSGGSCGVQLVRVLREQGSFGFILKLIYVLILAFIGVSILLAGVRTVRRGPVSGEDAAVRIDPPFASLPLQMEFPRSGLRTSVLLPVGAGFLVGLLASLLGVGGGFLMLPAMIYVMGIPTRVAVGTDLFQMILTCANVTLQQALVNGTVDVVLAVTLFVGSTLGAQLGILASRWIRGEQVRGLLAVIVLTVMAVLLYQLTATPEFLVDLVPIDGSP